MPEDTQELSNQSASSEKTKVNVPEKLAQRDIEAPEARRNPYKESTFLEKVRQSKK